ncbi:MAG: DUF1232 domain-containing protein, partial [Bdellovibrionales bacterium]|nr:DUF1232 domain-containing protein [Bdellovibrionales bacterium]
NKLKNFLTDTANDERIPSRDKKVLVAMVALLISPIDIIPDWIPVFGLIDDLIILSLILDYFFSVLDQSILLSHYPWGMKSFARIRRVAGFLSFFVPNIIKDNLWKYTRDPFN